MAGRPKDPTVNQKVFNAIDDILSKQHYHDMTVDQIANQSGVSKTTIYRRWSDKSFIIIDMFLEQTETYKPHPVSLYDDLYQFLIHVMHIYKSNLGIAVMEILINQYHKEAKMRFMEAYFSEKRSVLKDIIETYTTIDDEDLFIDLIFSPIYFNLIIKPEVLDEAYIDKILRLILRMYELYHQQ
ncbi:TetR/AcrR family transcriptional regulator [Staphylococcus pettenkoferi]|uniref:TetR/AcrR family transcriptional regulator n=1 Tax=Staphylococcus pettenkoferi TaxID=170573 RepID=UPI000CD0F3EC|nr:TetR family transcriptional regulator [Staphylococcus pettenkoferi]PNZ88764.1 TetR family transcriptional regulator [Staphylococcus pettenkoferi]QQC36582.1 TetR/AcrR family transcriptional regulator [Staphylococcus pettenkoferi]